MGHHQQTGLMQLKSLGCFGDLLPMLRPVNRTDCTEQGITVLAEYPGRISSAFSADMGGNKLKRKL